VPAAAAALAALSAPPLPQLHRDGRAAGVIAFIRDVHRAFDRLPAIVDGLPAEVGAVVR
jgi:hypothetical protein